MVKRMKKKFLVALLALASTFVCVFGLSACKNKPSDNGGNQGTVQPKPDDTDKENPDTPPVEDSKEEFDEAVKKVGDFIEKMKTSQNFTLSQKSANGEPIVIKFNVKIAKSQRKT